METFDYSAYRKRFHELKEELDTANDDQGDILEGILEEIQSIRDIAVRHNDGVILIKEIDRWKDAWLRGPKLYDANGYITRQELERILDNDPYFSIPGLFDVIFHFDGNEKLHPTDYSSRAIVDRWFELGLEHDIFCPWQHPSSRYNNNNENDCDSDKPVSISLSTLRRFLNRHIIALPTALYPKDARHTTCVLKERSILIERERMRRKEEREYLELLRLRRDAKESVKVKDKPLQVNDQKSVPTRLSKKDLIKRRFEDAQRMMVKLQTEGQCGDQAIAQELKTAFPELSFAEIGRLVPANPGYPGSYDAQKSRGQRLLGQKK